MLLLRGCLPLLRSSLPLLLLRRLALLLLLLDTLTLLLLLNSLTLLLLLNTLTLLLLLLDTLTRLLLLLDSLTLLLRHLVLLLWSHLALLLLLLDALALLLLLRLLPAKLIVYLHRRRGFHVMIGLQRPGHDHIRRATVIRGRKLPMIGAGCLLMLNLRAHRRSMLLVQRHQLLWPGTHLHSA